jgi:hypothetical protein
MYAERCAEMTAADLLGESHPLARANRRLEDACLQLLSGLTILAAIVVFAPGQARQIELVAGVGACAILAALVASSWSSRQRCALEVILRGDEDLPLEQLKPVRRRLRDPRARARLAASLERYLRSAERWDKTAPHMRPVANVRLLLPLEDDVRDIARLLRGDAVPRIRGVALCESLITDGVTSPLFRSDVDALRRELGRIRFSLDAC